jgi:hypothetical protein
VVLSSWYRSRRRILYDGREYYPLKDREVLAERQRHIPEDKNIQLGAFLRGVLCPFTAGVYSINTYSSFYEAVIFVKYHACVFELFQSSLIIQILRFKSELFSSSYELQSGE